jgi:hypothetical protein
LLLLLVAVASATAGARLERGRELLAEDAGSPPVALSDEQPPDGHLSYRIVKGILEKYVRMQQRVSIYSLLVHRASGVADHPGIIIHPVDLVVDCRASGQSVRVDLEKQKGDALKPLMNIP